jgi:hypothetical protein
MIFLGGAGLGGDCWEFVFRRDCGGCFLEDLPRKACKKNRITENPNKKIANRKNKKISNRNLNIIL